MKTEYNLYGDKVGKVQYIQHMGDEKTIVNAARVSYGVEKSELDERDVKLVKYLMDHQHTSTLEHNTITLKFTVPLFVARQHHRHRTWSFNEISRRYTSENLSFYHIQPHQWRAQDTKNLQGSKDSMLAGARLEWFTIDSNKLLADTLETYNEMLRFGIAREQARMILPQSMYTEYYGTVNLNNLYKFIALRIDKHSQWEIQQVANACLDIALELWPTPTQQFIDKVIK